MNSIFKAALLKFKENSNIFIPILIFGIIYSLISLINHYCFRTYARDLGIFTNALYDYAHFQWNKPTVLHLELENILGDHFTLISILFAPLIYIFGTYTLLIIQIVSILLGGLGVYKIIENKIDKTFATIAIIHFFSIWGIYSALAFDAHYSVIGTMFVPWLIYYLLKKNNLNSILIFIIILLTKENFSIWLFFIVLSFLITQENNKQQKSFLFALMIISSTYFYFVISNIMPSLSGENNEYIHFDYTILGSDFQEVIKTIIIKPYYTIKVFLGNFLDNSLYDFLKTETILAFLLSGGFLIFRKPQYIIILIPIFGQKFFNSYFSKWGLFNHYSIELVPIIAISFYLALNSLKLNTTVKLRVAIFITCISFLISVLMVRNSNSVKYREINYEFYNPKHYKSLSYNKSSYSYKTLYKELARISENSIVSAQSQMLPHLALRDKIYEFPVILDAQYIVLLPMEENKYPIKNDKYFQKIQELKMLQDWMIQYENDFLIIFKRVD